MGNQWDKEQEKLTRERLGLPEKHPEQELANIVENSNESDEDYDQPTQFHNDMQDTHYSSHKKPLFTKNRLKQDDDSSIFTEDLS